MPPKRLAFLLAITAASLCPVPCMADPVTYTATLLGSSVVPPTKAPATGTEELTSSGDLLMVHLDFGGLLSPATGAEIHCCADKNGNAPLVLAFTGFPQVTDGAYDHTFYLPGDLSGISEIEFLRGLNSGLAYTDLTSVFLPTGSIRGQITAESPVPEPGSLLLVSTVALPAAAICFGRARQTFFSSRRRRSLPS